MLTWARLKAVEFEKTSVGSAIFSIAPLRSTLVRDEPLWQGPMLTWARLKAVGFEKTCSIGFSIVPLRSILAGGDPRLHKSVMLC
ncbi:MAG: hypothetical protein ACPGOV_00505 [Magnetovibrionaceae bacterium]